MLMPLGAFKQSQGLLALQPPGKGEGFAIDDFGDGGRLHDPDIGLERQSLKAYLRTMSETPIPLADVLLPLAVSGAYSYRIPEGMTLAPGDYVQVPLGPRHYIGVVWETPRDFRHQSQTA